MSIDARQAMSAAIKEAADMMSAARISLLLGNPNPQPFFGPLAMGLKLVADPTCKTAWVDNSRIGFNPTFVIGLPHWERVTLVAHEVLHPALGDPWRRGDRDHHWWNVACDKRINRILLDAGFKLPPNCYIAEDDEIGKSAEWIYAHDQAERSKQEQEKPQPPPPSNPKPEDDEDEDEQESGDDADDDQQDGDDEGEEPGEAGFPGDEEGEGDSDEPGAGAGDDDAEDGDGSGSGKGQAGDGEGTGTGPGDDNPFGEVRDAQTGTDDEGNEEQTEEDWNQRTAAAAATAKGQGLFPGGLARAIEDALKPEVDTRAALIKFFQEAAPNDYTWSRPSRRYMAQGLYLPALHDKTLGEVAIMVDTSGSMDNLALGKARQLVQSVLDECKPAGVELVFADAEVNHTQRWESGDELTWEPQGGGGTDFCPALAYIDEGDFVCCICITDLDGTFPEVPPNVPVLWLSTDERHRWGTRRGQIKEAPFGDTLYVGE